MAGVTIGGWVSRLVLVTATATLVLLAAAPASRGNALKYVGAFELPASSDDEQSVLLVRRLDSVRVVDERGQHYDHRIPRGCRSAGLRFPRLLLNCFIGGVDRPSVLNVRTGSRQTPPLAPGSSSRPSGSTVDIFFAAGRYWIAGRRTFIGGGEFPLLMHRYTGQQVEYKGDADLDTPTLKITPQKGEPEPCGPLLHRSPGRRGDALLVLSCGRVFPVKRCPTGCFALTSDLVNGAYIEQRRLAQLDLTSRRVVRTWQLPPGPTRRVVLSLTRRAVFVNLRAGGSWRIYRGDLLGPLRRR